MALESPPGEYDVGPLEITFTHLRGNLSQKGVYTLYFKHNTDRNAFCKRPPPPDPTSTPNWMPSPSLPPFNLVLTVGTFILQLEVCGGPKTAFGAVSQELVGWVQVPLYELFSEIPRPFKLAVPTSFLDPEPKPSPGSIAACVTAKARDNIDLRPHREYIDARPALHTLRMTAVMLQSFMDAFSSPALAQRVKASYVFAVATLEYLCESKNKLDDVSYLDQTVVWHLSRIVEQHLSYFKNVVWESEEWPQKVRHELAEDLFFVISGALALVFGLADIYRDTSYKHVRKIAQVIHDGAVDFQIKLAILGARMHRIGDEPKPVSMPKNKFFLEIASKFATAYKTSMIPSGPWMEYLLQMQGPVATAMLDGFKAYIDHSARVNPPDGAKLRGTARRLMAMLAHSSHMLPSELELPLTSFSKDGPEKTRTAGVDGMLVEDTGTQKGSYGSVEFRAWWSAKRDQEIRVAIKTIDKAITADAIKHTYLEILNGWTLRHPHLLPTEGIVHKNNMVAIVSEEMKGGMLSTYIRKPESFRAMSHEKKIRLLNLWLRQIADGINYMHHEGVAHGDLHAGNIFLDTRDGTNHKVVIGDFGLSIYIDSASNMFQSTRSGNERYIAPEQCTPIMTKEELASKDAHFGIPTPLISTSRRPTAQTDLFSFAMLCIEVYTQERPFPELAEGTVATAILEGRRPTPLPVAIAEQERLAKRIETCWSQNPRDRETAAELFRDMQRLAPYNSP